MTSTDPTAWAIYERKTGALRYVVGGDLDIPALCKHYDVVPLYPAPTPPADDVREALAELVADGQAHPSFPRPAHVAPFERDFRVADAIIARFEVRPHGTVTDAEVEAGAQALYAADPILYALPEWREKIGTPKPWSVLNKGTRDVYRKRARPVLEAAAEARNA